MRAPAAPGGVVLDANDKAEVNRLINEAVVTAPEGSKDALRRIRWRLNGEKGMTL